MSFDVQHGGMSGYLISHQQPFQQDEVRMTSVTLSPGVPPYWLTFIIDTITSDDREGWKLMVSAYLELFENRIIKSVETRDISATSSSGDKFSLMPSVSNTLHRCRDQAYANPCTMLQDIMCHMRH